MLETGLVSVVQAKGRQAQDQARAWARERVAIIICSGVETEQSRARVINGLSVAQGFKQAGDTVVVLFDEAGTAAAAQLANPTDRSHRRLKAVWDEIAGVCGFCSTEFGVKDHIQTAGIPLLSECECQPSVHEHMVEGYKVLIF